MTTITPMQYTGDDKPSGEGYAPQIVLTNDSPRRGWNVTELNADYLPFTGEELAHAYDRFQDSSTTPEEMVLRWATSLGVTGGSWTGTHGFSQGDYGVSFAFTTPAWLEVTGATSLSADDHNDLCAWIWGDLYEVWEDDNEYPTIVYGMDNAMTYGEITF